MGGRILAREVDAGQRVQAGQRLFRLDPQDFDEAVSREDLERAELAVRNAVSRRDSARAILAQTQNARNYADLRAKQAGVMIEVMGEPGQVVGTGQAVAVLALDGEREIEVFLADGSRPPRTGMVRLAQGDTLALVLREVAGAADSVSRSWRARYRVQGARTDMRLGTVVHVALTGDEAEADALRVPVGALDERGEGPHVWLVQDGHVQAVPVEVVKLDLEQAHIRATLPSEARIVAFGTHLLRPGMAVRECAP